MLSTTEYILNIDIFEGLNGVFMIQLIRIDSKLSKLIWSESKYLFFGYELYKKSTVHVDEMILSTCKEKDFRLYLCQLVVVFSNDWQYSLLSGLHYELFKDKFKIH